MSLTSPEREVIIRWSDEDRTATIWSASRPTTTKLKKNPAAILISEGIFEGSAWAEFTIPARLISFRSSVAKRELTDEQRETLAERGRQGLRKARAATKASTG